MSHSVIKMLKISTKIKKKILEDIGGGRVNCPIAMSLHWAMLPISRGDTPFSITTRHTLTKAELFSWDYCLMRR